MKTFIMISSAMLLCFAAAPAGAQSCPQQEQQLTARVNRLQANSGAMGICQSSRESAQLYADAAAFHRRCVRTAEGEAQAREYDRAAAQARQTAASSCR